MQSANAIPADAGPVNQPTAARRTLILASVAHALHDGYTDVLYVLLPLWQAEFALGYGALALLRSINTGAMAAMQIPAGILARRIGLSTTLAGGTALAALGYALAGLSGSLAGLALGLGVSGVGSSTQHPLASSAVARAYGSACRGPLSTYNFSGDLGKATLPALVSLLLIALTWRRSLALIAALGLMVAIAIKVLLPRLPDAATPVQAPSQGGGRRGFALLFSIGVLDTGVRMGFLLFLPFLLKAKGASLPDIGLALSLLFAGGAVGKFVCGWLGARMGILFTVLVTETATAAAILGMLGLPLLPTFLLLPVLGLVLNGTSSVLYGTVPELARPGRTENAFALFYTGTIGSSALSPVLYGLIGDAAGAHWGAACAAFAALLTCPLMLALAPHLEAPQR